MELMGALQPGLLSPAMIPQGWHILVIDLKDCFCTISLHPEDCEWFAFTVPSTSCIAPVECYHWTVLPQGMKNSLTICQTYVPLALVLIHKKWQSAMIIHYMDDILIATKEPLPISHYKSICLARDQIKTSRFANCS